MSTTNTTNTTNIAIIKKPVPNSGYVGTVKINTSLSKDEVIRILDSITYPTQDFGEGVEEEEAELVVCATYTTAGTTKGLRGDYIAVGKRRVNENTNQYVIQLMDWNYETDDFADEEFWEEDIFNSTNVDWSNGWNPEYAPSELVLNREVYRDVYAEGGHWVAGSQNDKLIDLFYIEEPAPIGEKIIIDVSNRKLEYNRPSIILGVKGDNCSNRIFFECPRYINDFIGDLTSSNIDIYVYYKNSNNDICFDVCTNPIIYDVSADTVLFSWVITNVVTAKSGNVTFNICIKKTIAGQVENEWRTTSLVGKVLECV